jgi:hypothetical protein
MLTGCDKRTVMSALPASNACWSSLRGRDIHVGCYVGFGDPFAVGTLVACSIRTRVVLAINSPEDGD